MRMGLCMSVIGTQLRRMWWLCFRILGLYIYTHYTIAIHCIIAAIYIYIIIIIIIIIKLNIIIIIIIITAVLYNIL